MNNYNIDEKISNSKNNNFTLIKFIAAILVIIAHAYPITIGKGACSYICKLNNNAFDWGNFAVDIFLFLSGFLIAKSLSKKESFKNYLKKRVLRIFIPLVIMLFVSTFLIFPIFYDGDIVTYFTSISPYLYFIKNSFLIVTGKVLNIFSKNPYPYSVNGALWTLPVQFICYILGYILYKLKLNQKMNILNILVLIIFIFNSIYMDVIPYIIYNSINIGTMFYIGIYLYNIRNKIVFNTKRFLIALILYITFIYINYNISRILFLPYLILYVCLYTKPLLNNLFSKVGDLSYTIYLYGFMIQQCIVYIFNMNMSPILNIIIAIPVTLIIAYLQVNYIEKRINKVFYGKKK